jgi:parallel beta-helix repeat protein
MFFFIPPIRASNFFNGLVRRKIMRKLIGFAVKLLLILALFFQISSVRATIGTTYYVNNTTACDDFGPGTLSQPFCKIATGASVAFAGDTVRVLAGTYAETVKPNSGTAGSPVTFLASPGVTVTGEASNSTSGGAFRLYKCSPVCGGTSYVVIDGFTVTGTADHGIYANGSHNLVIRNNHVSGSGDPIVDKTRCGIYLTGTTDSTITGNTTDHNSLDGIRLVNASSNNTISNNISFANATEFSRTAEGINVITNSIGNTIIHNIVYANEDSGLNFYTGSGTNLVIGNVSFVNGDHGIDNNASPNNTIIGNTIQGNVTSGINVENSAGGATVMNNIVVDNGWNYVVGNPLPGQTVDGKPGNIRVDSTSTIGTNLDYNLYYLKGVGTAQIVWGSSSYTLLGSFQSTVPGQETHGLPGNPLFHLAAPIAQRPPDPGPYNVIVNVGDYHINAGSPAIDSANSAAPNEPTLDIEGYARADIPSVPNTGAGPRTYDDRGAYEFGYRVFLSLVVR